MSSAPGIRVLIIDDDKDIRSTLATCLEGMGCQVKTAADRAQAIAAVGQERFDIAFLDLRLREKSGLDLLPELLAENPDLAVIILTAYATFDTAVDAIKRGANDYLPKPFTPNQIRHLLNKFTERQQALGRVAQLDDELKQAAPEVFLETKSPRMQAAINVLSRAAVADAPVLFRGENGTGKGVLARWLHRLSDRRDRPFVVVNCPTLSEDLLTSELFGHARGAFTGAVKDQPGRVEFAEGGSLFLDEISEISPGLQGKLLRFLQEKQFERVGENRTRTADVRIVSATNRNLEQEVEAQRFRQDLLYRLNVIEVEVPALRDRPEDLLPLAGRFLAFFARTVGRPTPELSAEAQAAMLAYPWPGNVRELRNAMERALILWPARIIEPAALPGRMLGRTGGAPQIGSDITLEELERQHILTVLGRTSSLDQAAQILGIDASTLWRKRKKYEA